jgi:hypothetical protein
MFGRKARTIEKLQQRVEELEERLCPFNQHDWVEIDSYEIPINNYLDFDTVRVYKCRRCGKKRER